jgi:signal peptidase I
MGVVFFLVSSFARTWFDGGVSPTTTQPAEITDAVTKQEVPTVVVDKTDASLVVFQWGWDSMDRGNHDYYKARALVADVDYYDTHPVQRGDVVRFNNMDIDPKWREQIARVVGMPGERFKIVNGQIYIDGKVLATFYGREYHTGRVVEDSTYTVEEIEIPENHYYVIGDNWWRFLPQKKPISKAEITGKVLGYPSGS